MHYGMPRREFLLGMGVAAVTAVSSFPHEKVWAAEALYPPMDLSYFDTPISPGPSDIHFGYAAITWGGNDRQAIADIAALGFHGIQLRANVIKEFGSAPPTWGSRSDITTTWAHSGNVPKKSSKSSKPWIRAMPNWSWM